MSRRAITRVAGLASHNTMYDYYRFHVSGMPVQVSFGHWGRARTLVAISGKLVLDGVPFSAGADALAAAVPGIQRSDCGDYTEFFLPLGRRQTSFGFFTPPALPSVVIVNTAIRR